MQKQISDINDLVLYRERLGYTQKHVTLLLGTRSTTFVSEIELGHRLPTLKTAIKLSAIYRAPIEHLFTAVYRAIREEVRAREERLKGTARTVEDEK